MLEASVVIATRNRAGFLRDCLQRMAAQSAAGRFETVVVDNGSSDETQSVIAAAPPAANVSTVVVADPNRAKARNAGIAAAAGPIVIFCDDDTLAPDGFVDAHLRAHAAHRRAAVSGPIINVPDAGHLGSPSARHYSRAFFCTCNASVRRADLSAAGGFDERYDLYGWEDTDLGVRLRAQGVARAWSWDAFIYHVKPPAAMALSSRLELAREKGAMAARFVRKSPTTPVKLATGAYAANFLRAAVTGAPLFRRMYARLADAGERPSAIGRLAAEALVDAAYLDALREGLRDGA